MKLDRYGLFSSLLFWGLVLVLGGCNPEPGEIRVYFVRGGLGVETERPLAVTVYGADGPLVRWEPKQGGDRVKKLGPGKWLVRLGWQPADRLKVEIKTAETTLAREMTAPQKPSPFLISTLKLEEVRPYGGHAGVNPDTVLKFSPDNRYLAIGSFNGYLRILEVSGGRMILKKKDRRRHGQAPGLVARQESSGFIRGRTKPGRFCDLSGGGERPGDLALSSGR